MNWRDLVVSGLGSGRGSGWDEAFGLAVVIALLALIVIAHHVLGALLTRAFHALWFEPAGKDSGADRHDP